MLTDRFWGRENNRQRDEGDTIRKEWGKRETHIVATDRKTVYVQETTRRPQIHRQRQTFIWTDTVATEKHVSPQVSDHGAVITCCYQEAMTDIPC